MLTTFRAACELKRKLRTALFAAVLLSYAGAAAPALASASARVDVRELRRDHAAAAYGREGGQEHPPAASATGEHAEQPAHGEAEAHDASITGMLKGMAWPVANFVIFIGVLYYFFNKPFSEYLSGRSATIRKDLVEAAELRNNANAQLAAIDQKLQALPGEVSALRSRGAGRDQGRRAAHCRRRRRRSRTAARADAPRD